MYLLLAHSTSRLRERVLCFFMRRIIDLKSMVQNISNASPGVISTHETKLSSTNVELDEIANELRKKYNIPLAPPRPQTTFDLLFSLCDGQIAGDQRNNLDGFVMPVWYKLRKITHSMCDLGFIPDTDQFHFCQLDLFARNILVNLPDDKTVEITGVLDWDARYAYFCPKFVAFGAPFWLWLDDDIYEDDEELAVAEPKSQEQRQIKNLFEELASEEGSTTPLALNTSSLAVFTPLFDLVSRQDRTTTRLTILCERGESFTMTTICGANTTSMVSTLESIGTAMRTLRTKMMTNLAMQRCRMSETRSTRNWIKRRPW
jgi:hypothetical protein